MGRRAMFLLKPSGVNGAAMTLEGSTVPLLAAEKTPRKDSFGATNKISDPHKLTLAGYWDSPKVSQADADSLRKRRNSSGTARRASILDLGSKVKDLVKETKEAAEDELRYEALRFAHTTTAHGIPMALNATRWYARMLWVALSLFSVGIFVYQCVLVLQKFQRKDKIVSVELQFESASFPAVTICNLNPFKTHLARRVPEISETLDAYHQAVTYSKDAAKHYDTSSARYRRNTNPGGFRYVQYEPVMSDCDCDAGSMKDNGECVQKDTIPKNNLSLCICNYDRQDSTAWPCFSANSWADSVCPECVDLGYCNLPQTTKASGTDHHIPCLCQRDVKYCLLRPERLKRMWEIRGNQIPEEGSPFRADFLAQLKELGYENMTDGVAISTKTKEKLILTMAGLPSQRRIALSYGKTEFIRMCSFNGQQCNIINDFKLHVDPAFGNCYTFNANRDKPLVSSRAGPSYGLRLLVYINASDYLPTTEASGVRIAIHAQEEYPFPDTFGYSAPTGSVSSFGMSMRKVNRLCISGDCDCVSPNDPLPVDYIYQNYKYEPEGCFKSCYQNQIIRRCGCADPRYPTPRNDTKLCDSLDPLSRNCLLVEGIKFTRSHMCRCKHPCVHDVYTTTYSSAKLTPGAFQAVRCKAEDCIDDMDSESMAMLEIYYEQMSYEKLTEHESYLFVNFISDVGGQAGLWLGASVLTLIEIIVFLLRVMTIVCRRRFRKGDINEYKFSMDNPFSAKRYSDASGGMGIEKPMPPAPKPSTVGNDAKRDSLPPDIKLTLNPADAVDYSPRKLPRYDDTERERTDTTEVPSDDEGDKDPNNTATDIADEDYDTYRNSLKPPDVDMYYRT